MASKRSLEERIREKDERMQTALEKAKQYEAQKKQLEQRQKEADRKDNETGQVHDYTHKSGVVMREILLPERAPERLSDRQTLWNEVQSVEKRSDAQLAREIEVAFPIEITRDEQIECVKDYIRENFVSEGMIADWALHDKGDGNPHAHIMLTMRGFDEDGEWTKKQKSVFANSRDAAGKAVYDPALPSYDPQDREGTSQYRIPVLDKDGKQKTRVREGKGTEYLWEKVSIPANDWNDHSKAEIWRLILSKGKMIADEQIKKEKQAHKSRIRCLKEDHRRAILIRDRYIYLALVAIALSMIISIFQRDAYALNWIAGINSAYLSYMIWQWIQFIRQWIERKKSGFE